MAEVVDDKIKNVSDIIESLSADDDAIDEVTDNEIVTKDEEEPVEEIAKDEDEDEIKLDEAPDELEFQEVPRRKEILKEFPEIFKKFPGIEKALYRENQYSEIFPTIKDAQAAQEELGELKGFKDSVMEGSLDEILKTVKEDNPETFGKIAASYLQTLAKVDERAYYNTIGHIIDRTIYTFFENGKQVGGEDGEQMQIAAQLLNKFVKGNVNIQPPKQEVTEPKDNEREKKISEREKQFAERELNNAVSDVSVRAENIIKSAIDKHIDPKDQMTSYIRSKAVSDVLEEIKSSIDGDKRFKSTLDKLWLEAKSKDYDKASRDKIRNAILSKTKTVLPDAIRKVRADALKGSGAKVKEVVRKEKESDDTPRKSSVRTVDTKPLRRQSTLDVLMQD